MREEKSVYKMNESINFHKFSLFLKFVLDLWKYVDGKANAHYFCIIHSTMQKIFTFFLLSYFPIYLCF